MSQEKTTWQDVKKGIRIISRKIREHKWVLAGFSVLGLISTIGNTAMPFLTDNIAESGTHENLITHDGEYKRLHDLQIGLHE